MHDVKFETYLERKKEGNYLDTKFTDIAFCNQNLHVKEVILSHRVVMHKMYVNINGSV